MECVCRQASRESSLSTLSAGVGSQPSPHRRDFPYGSWTARREDSFYESQWDVVTGCRSATLKTAALPGYRGVRFARLPLEVSLRGISAVPTCRNAMVRVLAHSVRPAYSLW